MTGTLSAVLSVVRKPMMSLLAAAALAGCAGVEAPRPMHVAAEVEEDTLQLAVENIPPGREIVELVLVDESGGETPARDRELITRETGSGGNAGPGVGIGATGGSSSGVNPFISLGYIFGGGGRVERSQRMTAAIPLSDPAAYAARYRDQLGELRQVAVPAPAP